MKITRQGDHIVVDFLFPQGHYSYRQTKTGDWHYRPHHLNHWIGLKTALVPASVFLRVQRFLQAEERKAS